MEVDSLTLGGTDYSQKVEQSPKLTNGNAKKGEVQDVNKASNITKENQETDKKKGKEITIFEEDIEKTISMANKKIEPLFLEFHYKIHQKTNQLMISVINTQTKEVVRDIPPEKTLDALAKMWELTGILVDKKG